MKGPGALAMNNHDDLVARLANLCAAHGFTYAREAIVGQTPYRQPFTVDLLIADVPGCPDGLAVVARYQALSGSADQKFPYLAFCIRRSEVPCVVVLDGGGWSDGALAWLAQQRAGRLVDLLTPEGFEAFLVATRAGTPALATP